LGTEPIADEHRARSALGAFRHRDYVLYWVGMCISNIGTWMQNVGLSWLVLEMTGSPFLLGVQTAAQYAPVIVLSLVGGSLADRFAKRKILIMTQSTMMLSAFVLAAMTGSDRLRYWHIIALSLISGAATGFDAPARQAFTIEIVDREDLMSAISLNAAMFNMARIAGPAAAGLVLGAYGPAAAFFLNGLSFLAIILPLLVITPKLATHNPRRGTLVRAIRDDIAEGIAFIARTPTALFAVAALFFVAMFSFNHQVLIPIVAKEVLGETVRGYGFLMSVLGLGALVSALVMSYAGRRQPRLSTLMVGAFCSSALVAAMGFAPSFIVSAGLALALGWWHVAFMATANTLLQYEAPDDLRGRVMSVYALVVIGSSPAGSVYIGWVTGALGGRAGCLAAGLAGIAAAVFLLSWVRRRRLAGQPLRDGLAFPPAGGVVGSAQRHAGHLAEGDAHPYPRAAESGNPGQGPGERHPDEPERCEGVQHGGQRVAGPPDHAVRDEHESERYIR
jgi:MFS family permease